MNHHQHANLTNLLLSIPGIQNYSTRTALLAGIPNTTSLMRDEENARTDINQLITQLSDLYLNTGEPTLSIFLGNAQDRVTGTSLGVELLKQQRQFQSQGKPVARDDNEAVPTTPHRNDPISTTLTESKPIFIVYSYVPEDKKYYEELEKHFSTMKKQKLIRTWHRGDIAPGAKIHDEFKKALLVAEIVLLLVSADWLNSEYLYEQQIRPVLERYRQGLIQVIPIIVRDVDTCEFGDFGELSALPSEKRPITAWKANREAAFSSITRDIRQVVEKLKNRQYCDVERALQQE